MKVFIDTSLIFEMFIYLNKSIFLRDSNVKKKQDLTNCIKNSQICLYFCGNDDIVAVGELF